MSNNYCLATFVFILGLSITSAYTIRSKRQVLADSPRPKCTTPDGGEGICKDLALCRPYINILRRDIQNETVLRMVRQANRICNQPTPIVCCPIETYTLPTPEDGCGVSARSRFSADKIVGGQPARLGQYPWMALLFYRLPEGLHNPDCGGSLITNRHVLTAAHCITQTLSFARLGEYNTSTDDETQHQDIPIERTVRHPRFNRLDGHSDVGVLYLLKHVEYTDNIKPICLPFYNEEIRQKDFTGFTPFVVGWGHTENGGNRSDVLMEVQIEIFENSVCDTRYDAERRKATARQFDSGIMCAGYLLGERGDCNGDSGGPLMLPIRNNRLLSFHLFGIVSYGVDCARQGFPGVYASVQYFIDWIAEKVADPI